MTERDDEIRLAAFAYLTEQTQAHGDVLPHGVLKAGFPFEGARIHLVGQTGIFKPKEMELPLTLKTVPVIEGRARPYEDAWLDDDRVLYRYRGSDPMHHDNVGVRSSHPLGSVREPGRPGGSPRWRITAGGTWT